MAITESGDKGILGGFGLGDNQKANQLFDPVGFFRSLTISDPSLNQGMMSGFDRMGAQAQNRQINPDVYSMLMGAAQGNAPSAAQLQLQSGLQQQQAMAQSLAASNPNISPALAQRQAMDAMSQEGLQTNQQMGILRAQEMAQARGQVAGYTLQQQALNDAMTQFYMQQGFSRAQAEMKAKVDVDTANLKAETERKGALTGAVGALAAA